MNSNRTESNENINEKLKELLSVMSETEKRELLSAWKNLKNRENDQVADAIGLE